MGEEEMQDVSMAGESDEDREERGAGEAKDDGEGESDGRGENGGVAEGNAAETDGGGDELEEEESENEDSDSESDDDDDDDDDEDDMNCGKRVEELEEALAANIYSYDAHVQLISALRKAGDLEKLRAAREAMNTHFPLAPDMWREWAQDEARLASRAYDVRAVEALYERGIQDYLSVTLWLEYLKFVEERDASVAEGTSDGVSKLRRLYERALAAVGLHFAEGGRVWEAYREFEQALLVLMASGGEGRIKQVENVRNLFRRELTIPQHNLAKILEDYKEWEGQQGNYVGDENNGLAGLPPNVCSAYTKALHLCGIRELHEERIARGKPGDAELLQHYLGYITIEEASGEPARAQILYERAVSAFPLSQDIWMKYTKYLESSLKVAPVLKSVYTRAVRNCPWVEVLWKNYLLVLERIGSCESEISAVFEQALLGGFPTAQEYLDLFLTRCDGLRRRILATEEGPDRLSHIQSLHTTFDRASQFLAAYYPDFVDRTLQLHTYWADIEVYIAKDIVAARGVWEGLVKSSGWMIEVWQAYIAMEVTLKNIKEARAIYRASYSRRLEGNGTEVMCTGWLRFEREHGTLEDYDRAALKVGPRIAEVQVMQHQQEVKSAQNPTVNPRTQQGTTEAKTRGRAQLGGGGAGQMSVQGNASDSADAKRKRGQGFRERTKPKLKRAKVDKAAAVKKPSKVLLAEEASKVVGRVSDSDKKGCEENKEMVPEAGTSDKDAVMDDASQKTAQKTKPSRQYTDECTAFVSNISFEVTVEQLTEFFSSVAGVKEVRMLREKFTGRPRGLAYVDFEDEESLAAAVTKDKEELSGRKLTVARSAPRGGDRGGGQANAGRGRGDHAHRGGRHGGRHADESREGGPGGHARGVGFLGHRRGGKVNFTGSNTFAVPRSVRPLGWNPGQAAPSGDEVLTSNDEFRKMLLNKK